MGIMEKNFEALKKNRPGFYNRLKKLYEEKEYSFVELDYVDTRDGNHALVIEREEKKLRMNSMYRPLQEASRWAEQFAFQNIEVVTLMFGMGNGYFVQEIRKRLGEDGRIYLYEPDVSVFIYILEHEDLTDIIWDNRVFLYVESIDTNEFLNDLMEKVHWSNLPTQILCAHPEYDKAYPEAYKEFLDKVQRANQLAVVNRNTVAVLSKDIVVNAIKNLHFIKESNYITEFHNIAGEDVPAIIVSAGPSLDKNIEELKKAVGKAFIIATDTAVKYLLAHDIPFDAMITLDAHKSSAHISDPRCAEVPLFCILEAKNEIMEFHTGRKIWFRSGTYIESLYEKFDRKFLELSTGGSVATGAYVVCFAMGIKKIILIGQDLAFAGDVTHAGGIEKHTPRESEEIVMVEGIDGNMVKSRFDWVLYRDWFENSIKSGVGDGMEVIDATEGGALIHGSKVMTLSDAIDEYCVAPFDFGKLMEELSYTFSKEEYEKVKKECLRMEKELTDIYQKAKQASTLALTLIKMIESGKTDEQKEQKMVSKIKRANHLIQKCTVNELLEIYVSESTTKAMKNINCLSDDSDQNMLDTLQVSKIVYDEMMKGAEEMRPLILEALGKL